MKNYKLHPKAGPGRPRGSPNKLSRTSKENIAWVFQEIGDRQALKKWVESNPRNRTIFYTQMYTKLIALEVAHSGEVEARVVFIMPRPGKPEEKK